MIQPPNLQVVHGSISQIVKEEHEIINDKISTPGQRQGLLHKHGCDSFINWLNHFMSHPPPPQCLGRRNSQTIQKLRNQ